MDLMLHRNRQRPVIILTQYYNMLALLDTGAIPPQKLSGGCKAVILMEVLDKPHVYATKCGDNCVSDILKIAKEKDVEITLHHVMEFPEHFEAMMMESGKQVTSMEEFVDEFYKIRSNNR